MTRKNGFTLIEMLFILAILSILILLFIPAFNHSIQNHQVNQFLYVLHSDVLFMQNLSTGNKTDIRMIFKDNHYIVSNYLTNDIYLERKYPNELTIETRTLNYVSFNDKGSIRYPGTIQIKSAHKNYRLVFPLGKGRFYIDES